MLIRSPKELALFVMSQRKALKLSQSEMGGLVGLQQKTISLFENKPENIQLDTLFRILSAVELDLNIVSKKTSSTERQWTEEW